MILGRLSVGRMILLIGLSFLLPIALSTTLLMREHSWDVQQAELERSGLAHQSALVDILVGLAEYAHGMRAGESVAKATSDISAGYTALAELQASSAKRLSTTAEALAAAEIELARSGGARGAVAKSRPGDHRARGIRARDPASRAAAHHARADRVRRRYVDAGSGSRDRIPLPDRAHDLDDSGQHPSHRRGSRGRLADHGRRAPRGEGSRRGEQPSVWSSHRAISTE